MKLRRDGDSPVFVFARSIDYRYPIGYVFEASNERLLATDDASLQRLRMGRVRASADVFRALADPTRRAILDRLRAGPAAVNSLAEDFEQTRPSISKHLRVLREASLVREERLGRERFYELDPRRLQVVASWIDGYRAFWIQSLDNLKRFVEESDD